MSSWATNSLRRVAEDIRASDSRSFSADVAESFALALELVYREILVQEQLDGHSTRYSRVCTLIRRALEALKLLQDGDQQHSSPPVVHTGLVGWPYFDIPQEQICVLVENGFTCPEIADIIGVSLTTIRR